MNFSIPKKFLAPAHFCARTCRIFYHLVEKTMIFKFSQRHEICRAHPKFFYECYVCHKISLQFFLFDHSSKIHFLEQFEVWWAFLKFRFFSKILKISKFSKNRLKKRFFVEKNQILMNFKGTYFYEFWSYKYIWDIKKHLLCSKILFWEVILPCAHFRARCGR